MDVWELLVDSAGWLLLGVNLLFIAHLHLNSRARRTPAQQGRWLMLVYLVGLPLVSVAGYAIFANWQTVVEFAGYPSLELGVLAMLAMIWRQGPRAARYVQDGIHSAASIGVGLSFVSLVAAHAFATTVYTFFAGFRYLSRLDLSNFVGIWAACYLTCGIVLLIFYVPQVLVFGQIFGMHLRRSLASQADGGA